MVATDNAPNGHSSAEEGPPKDTHSKPDEAGNGYLAKSNTDHEISSPNPLEAPVGGSASLNVSAETESIIDSIIDHYSKCDITEGFLQQKKDFATRVVHCGLDEDEQYGALVPAITLSSTYKMKPGGQWGDFAYSRLGNPTRTALEESIASLEGAKYAVALGSGLSAVKAVTMLLNTGDHIVVGDDLYGGTSNMWRTHTERTGVTFSYVDSRDLEAIEKAMQPNTKMIYVETPSNPAMKVTDLAGMVEISRRHPGTFTVCDNTFLSPFFQRPLSFGIDIVLESLTKYLNGHSDVVMGAVATNREDLYGRLRNIQIGIGLVPGPFDCYMAFRGMKTLHVRMPHHMLGGLTVASFLEQHLNVLKVLYPGLPSHSQHALMKQQTYGCSGMISFYIRGDRDQAMAFFSHLKLFKMAVSLGGYKSLAVGPSFSTHIHSPKDELECLGITDNMVRLSVGLEDPRDLCRDLDQALNAACAL